MLVDVGGGLGHVSLEIAGVRPDLKIIIEDRPQVLKYAKEVSCRASYRLAPNI